MALEILGTWLRGLRDEILAGVGLRARVWSPLVFVTGCICALVTTRAFPVGTVQYFLGHPWVQQAVPIPQELQGVQAVRRVLTSMA